MRERVRVGETETDAGPVIEKAAGLIYRGSLAGFGGMVLVESSLHCRVQDTRTAEPPLTLCSSTSVVVISAAR